MKPALTWVVLPGDGRRVRDIVRRMRAMGAGDAAGVWLNGRRAGDDEGVEVGDYLELRYRDRDGTACHDGASKPVVSAGAGANDLGSQDRFSLEGPDSVRILAQRDGIVLAYKPAGIPTEPERAHRDSLVGRLRARLGGAEVHTPSRLDLGVSGIVIATLGRDAARRVELLQGRGHIRKSYLGIAAGGLLALRPHQRGTWKSALGTERDSHGRLCASHTAANRRPARTEFEVVAAVSSARLLRLLPQTGRMHQLRAHAALAGGPLLGDRLYGGLTSIAEADGRIVVIERVLLHAVEVQVDESLRAHAPAPEDMRAVWRALGGSATALA